MQEVIVIIAQVLFVLICFLDTFAILLQEGKGGGLSAMAGGSSQQVIGTSNPLRRLTVILSLAFFGLAVILAWAMKPSAPAKPGAGGKNTPGMGENKDTSGAGGTDSRKTEEHKTSEEQPETP